MKLKPKKTVLFWSGGKDSWLARNYLQLPADQIVLLTTYNEEESVVPFQNIPLSSIQNQAIALGHLLTAVPLPYPCSNEIYIERVVAAIAAMPFEIDKLAFGDWKLEDIRIWREEQFGERGFSVSFPIWGKPLEELLARLESLPGRIVVCGVRDDLQDVIKPGSTYSRKFIDRLPDSVDPMGEYGEFHTELILEA